MPSSRDNFASVGGTHTHDHMLTRNGTVFFVSAKAKPKAKSRSLSAPTETHETLQLMIEKITMMPFSEACVPWSWGIDPLIHAA